MRDCTRFRKYSYIEHPLRFLGAQDVDQYTQAQPDGIRGSEGAGRQTDALQNMFVELCKCQQTWHCPGKDVLKLLLF